MNVMNEQLLYFPHIWQQKKQKKQKLSNLTSPLACNLIHAKYADTVFVDLYV